MSNCTLVTLPTSISLGNYTWNTPYLRTWATEICFCFPTLYSWCFPVVITRFFMIQMGLDTHGAGLFDKLFETVAHRNVTRDPRWSDLLKSRRRGTDVWFKDIQISRSSIDHHSLLFFEPLVDSITPKEHYSFAQEKVREHGLKLPQ